MFWENWFTLFTGVKILTPSPVPSPLPLAWGSERGEGVGSGVLQRAASPPAAKPLPYPPSPLALRPGERGDKGG